MSSSHRLQKLMQKDVQLIEEYSERPLEELEEDGLDEAI
jgi:hypothetical protein